MKERGGGRRTRKARLSSPAQTAPGQPISITKSLDFSLFLLLYNLSTIYYLIPPYNSPMIPFSFELFSNILSFVALFDCLDLTSY